MSKQKSDTIGKWYNHVLDRFTLKQHIEFVRKFGSPKASIKTKCKGCEQEFGRHKKTECKQ